MSWHWLRGRHISGVRSFAQKVGVLLLAIGWLPLSFFGQQASAFAVLCEQRGAEYAFSAEDSSSPGVQFHQLRERTSSGAYQRSLGSGPLDCAQNSLALALAFEGQGFVAATHPRFIGPWQFALRAASSPRAPCAA